MTDSERLTALQSQAERTAGQILTRVCHEPSAQERARLLSLAMWFAGRGTAYEEEAVLAQPRPTEETAGRRRR